MHVRQAEMGGCGTTHGDSLRQTTSTRIAGEEGIAELEYRTEALKEVDLGGGVDGLSGKVSMTAAE
jgi:hypothetical protein